MSPKSVILFLATGEDSTHLMAEGLTRAHGDDQVEVVTAARRMAPPDPVAVRVMREGGIDIGELHVEALDELLATVGQHLSAALGMGYMGTKPGHGNPALRRNTQWMSLGASGHPTAAHLR